MKTILVPTDFSNVANNALDYALDLATYTKSRIILFHAYQVPVPTGDVPVMLVSPQELEKENKHRIEELRKKVTTRLQDPKMIETVVSSGFAVEEILDQARKCSADLIVMGVTGSGKISEVLLGSNATAVLSGTQIPVLIVPERARFRKPEKLVLAYDYESGIREHQIKHIQEVSQLFKSKILVLDVVKPNDEPTSNTAIAGLRVEQALSGIEHSVYFPEGIDVEDSINKFVDTYQADWLVMLPREHSLLSRLFQRSNTKKLTFHTHVPLLSLHE